MKLFSRFSALGIGAVLVCLSTLGGAAPLGPGWHDVQGEDVTPDEARAYRLEQVPPDLEGDEGVPPVVPGVDEITTEIEELARGLLNDPKLIFEFVHNHIDYQPYYGTLKGATLALLERSGNDFDQAALLVALLRESGFTANYKFGTMDVPANALDDVDVDHWLSVEGNAASQIISNGGIPAISFLGGGGDTSFVRMDRVWVEVDIEGTNYLMDPAFKTYQEFPGIDLATAMGFDRAQLLAAAGGTVTTDYVQNLDTSAFNAKLTDFAMNLATEIRTNHPNAEVDEVIGGRRINPVDLTSFSTTLPFPSVLQNTWTSIPTAFDTTVRFQLGTLDVTIPTGTIHGRRISLSFDTGGNPAATLWLDDTALAPESGTVTGSQVNMSISVDHPYPGGGGTYQDQSETKSYRRDSTYAIIYGFGGSRSGGVLGKRRRQLDDYRAAGLAGTSREMLSENLNIMGMSWMKQTSMVGGLIDQFGDTYSIQHHRFGRMGQESGYYVDVGLQSGSTAPQSTAPGADDGPVFRARSLFASAMEHSVIEQLQDNASASTIKLLTMANNAGDKIFLADAANYASVVRPQLTGYSVGTLNFFQAGVDFGTILILPQNGQRVLSEWNGTGYIDYFDIPGFVISQGMIIYGGYFGGFAGMMGPLDPDRIFDHLGGDPTTNTGEPTGLDNPASREPVDLATGAYLYHGGGITVGLASPARLSFAPSYNSLQRLQDTGLGFGWTHNLHGMVMRRSDLEAPLGETTPLGTVAFAAGVYAALDLSDSIGDVQHWTTGALAAGWAVDGLVGNSVAVELGSEQMQFLQLPDGSYSSPAGVTAQLVETGGLFSLVDRFDRTIDFNAEDKIASMTDADGNAVSFTYNPDGTLQQVADGFGHTLSFTYAGGRIDTVADSTGRSVQYGYSGAGDLTSFTDLESHLWTYGYDTGHRITSLTNPKLEVMATNLYGPLGRVTSQEVEGAHTWQFLYAGYLSTEEDPAGNQSHYFFDDKGRQTGTENAEGDGRAMEYDGQNHLTRLVDPEGNETLYDYDGNHNLTKVTDAQLNEMTFTYDTENLLETVTDQESNVVQYQYDAEYHRTRNIDELLNETVFTYTAEGFVQSVTSRTGHTTSYTYDAFGSPDVTTFPDAETVDYSYDARGDLASYTDANGDSFSFTYDDRRLLLTTLDDMGFGLANVYDSCANLTQSTDRAGRVYQYTYSPLSNLLTRTLPNGSVITHNYGERNLLDSTVDGMGEPTQFTYDPVGRLVETFQEPAQRIALSYDQNSRRDMLRNQNLQDWTFNYDSLNRLTSTVTPLGRTTTRTYNSRNLLETVTDPSTQLRTYTYTDSGRLARVVDGEGQVDFTYHDNQVLHTITEGAEVITRLYDNRDRLSQFTDAAGNTIGYDYDAMGNLTEVIYPDLKKVTYDYDAAGRMTTVTDWNSRVTSYAYDGNGRLHTTTRPNGTVRIRTYNAAGQLSQVREETSGAVLVFQHDYSYDLNERVVREDTVPAPTFHLPTAAAMTYDADNRLATYNGQAVVHDPDGNMTTGPLDGVMSTLVYDARNRLTDAGGVTYGYDAEDRRVSSTDGSGATTFVNDPNSPISRMLVRFAPGGVTTRYVYGLGGLLYEDVAGTTRTYHYDFRGSTVALSDAAENVTGRVEYTPFGEIAVTTGTTDTPFLFNGRLGVMTDGNGLYFMRARYYVPETGRFLNADPIGLAGGLNEYAFASNNPTFAADPSGLLVIYVHGTFSDTSAFSAAERTGYNETFSDRNETNFGWSGANSAAARETAGAALAAQIAEYRATHPTEPITVVAHSHGGNVALEATQGGANIDNLVTIGTPSRPDHTADRGNIGKWFNVYSESDGVQSNGGGAHDWYGIGEWGDAGRQFDGAINIEIDLNTGPVDTHSDLRIHGVNPLRHEVNRSSKP